MAEYNRMLLEHPFFVRSFVSAYRFLGRKHLISEEETVYDFSQLVYLAEGEALYTVGGESYPVGPGDMVYRPAGIPFSYTFKSERVSLSLVSFLMDSPSMAAFFPAPFPLYGEEISTFLDLAATGVRITRPIREEGLIGQSLIEGTPPEAIGFVGSSLERFLSMVYCRLQKIEILPDRSRKVAEYRAEEALAAEARAYLEEHLAEPLFLSSLAERFGVSQSTLSRAFRRCYNRSLVDWVLEEKVMRAKDLIEEASMNFTEIADALGYSSVNYFSKAFKKKTGMTPTEYSKSAPLIAPHRATEKV